MNKSKQGQSFLDLVLQQTGSFEAVILAAVENNIAPSDDLNIGSEILISKENNEVTNYLSKNRPATAIGLESDYGTQKLGIGYMQIGSTFKVE